MLLELVTVGVCVAYVSKRFKGGSTEEDPELEVLRRHSTWVNYILDDAKVYSIMNDHKRVAYCKSAEKRDHYIDFKISMPAGTSKKDLLALKGKLQTHFKADVDIVDIDHNYTIRVWTTVLNSTYPFNVVSLEKSAQLMIAIGATVEGQYNVNLNESPHILVAGKTGAGKSKLVQGMLCYLIETKTPKELQLYILDMKKVEMHLWQYVAHVKEVALTAKRGCDIIYGLNRELDRRSDLLVSKGAKNITQYNERVHESARLPYIVVLMDELYDYTTALPKSSKTDKDTGELLNPYNQTTLFDTMGGLMSKSRSAGIHFIAGTQRPTSDILPSSVNTHFTARVGLATSKEQESINIIEETGLELIRSNQKGRGIIKDGDLKNFQAYFIEDDDVDAICIKHFTKEGLEKYKKDIARREAETLELEEAKPKSKAKEKTSIAIKETSKVGITKVATPKETPRKKKLV